MKNIIIGAGTFGTAIANELLSNSNNEVITKSTKSPLRESIGVGSYVKFEQ